MKKKNIQHFILSLVIGSFAFAVLMVIFYYVIHTAEQNERLEVTNNYIDFQNQIESIIYKNITLADGYLAYAQTVEEIEWEKTEVFLEHLIDEKTTYIRNFAVIEDTTIIMNYPLEGNEESIGVDLALVEAQRDVILRAKETLEPTFQGPVNLVQGGTGFIVRLPFEKDNAYYGQVSIVIDGDRLLHVLEEEADIHDLAVRIYNSDTLSEGSFFETGDFGQSDALKYQFSADLVNWTLYVVPKDGWHSHTLWWMLTIMVSLAFGFVCTLLYKKFLIGQREIAYQANHDFLTGLYNRNFLDEYQQIMIAKAKREERHMAVLLTDINKFKAINDLHGHHIGDEALKTVAKVLNDSIRTNEAAFRLGGDEFLVLFPEIETVEDVLHVSQRLQSAFTETIEVDTTKLALSLSIGYAVFPEDGEDIDQLLKTADQRMYREKGDIQSDATDNDTHS